MKSILICAMSLDGRIARYAGDPLEWTTRADMRFFKRETTRIGVVVMGRVTHQQIGRPLPGRLNVVWTRSASQYQSIPDVLEFTDEAPKEIVASLERRGLAEMALIGGGVTNAAFLQAGLVDEIWVSVMPKILGRGIGLFDDVALDADLEYLSQEMLDEGALLLRYRVKSAES